MTSIPTRRTLHLLIGAALAASAGIATSAEDYPPRKPGLWQMSVQASGNTMTMQHCIDAATDQAMRDMGKGEGKNACASQSIKREGDNKMVVDSVCKTGGSTATTHAVVTGDFSTGYRMDMQTTFSPPMAGRATDTSVIEAKWLGACKAGQKPGDMMMPGGMKMNIRQMPGAPR